MYTHTHTHTPILPMRGLRLREAKELDMVTWVVRNRAAIQIQTSVAPDPGFFPSQPPAVHWGPCFVHLLILSHLHGKSQLNPVPAPPHAPGQALSGPHWMFVDRDDGAGGAGGGSATPGPW